MTTAVLDVERPAFMAEEDVLAFEHVVGAFFDDHARPADCERWRANGVVDRDLWFKAGQAGLLGVSIPEAYGGAGGDYRHDVILIEQIAAKAVDGFGVGLHNAIVAPYILHHGTEEQRRRWLPGVCSGAYVTAIALTEPGTGSDLQAITTTARRLKGDWVINGQKTFVSNGQTANLICVAARTEAARDARDLSLFFVETDRAEGFERGRKLAKLGQDGAGTCELFFSDVRVPAGNLLGGEAGQGFFQMMNQLPQERLNLAVQALGAIERALGLTLDHVKTRTALGKPLIDSQSTQFKLAECKTKATVARVFIDWAIDQHLDGALSAVQASMAKYWITDLENEILDQCLQMFGGWGYTDHCEILRMGRDSRVQRIYGGTNEIMKVLIATEL